MSEPNSQGEPTMEEILASIRKIISEDGPDAEAAEAESAPEAEAAETSGAPAAAPEEAGPAAGAEVPPAEAAAAAEDEDVLDLTQEVKEDGTVVDLKAKREGAAEPMPVAEPEPEEPADLELSDEAAASEMPPLEPEPQLEPQPEPVEMEAPAAETPEPEPAMAAAAAMPEAEEAGLLANKTRDAATASLVELAVTAGLGADGRDGSGASGQTLEMLVREALRPYLKSWLDENLAPLVERIVREEIQKMVKRAEYR